MKILLSVLLTLAIFILVGIFYYEKTTLPAQNFKIGVTFSPTYATKLNLDWRQVYQDILDNLKVKNLRLVSHWDDLEPSPNEYYFADLDYQIEQAAKSDTDVLLVLGAKQPGWPECYAPDWTKSLTLPDRRQKVLDFIRLVVERYRTNSSIKMWQVENEPLFNYGANCDPADPDFLKTEVTLVKSLNPARPIVVTDSGELSLWLQTMPQGDIFGTTMYRTVHNPLLGYFTYPIPPAFYTFKSNLMRRFAQNSQKTIITELQAEPWFSKPLTEVPVDTQAKVFSVQNLKENIEYARKTGFDTVYLWGAEWWYFMAKNGHPQYLEEARKILR